MRHSNTAKRGGGPWSRSRHQARSRPCAPPGGWSRRSWRPSALRPRRARGGPNWTRRPARSSRPRARPRAGHRDRALVPGRRPGQLSHRRGRLDHPQRRRQPRGARRAHRRHHGRRPADPDRPLTPSPFTGLAPYFCRTVRGARARKGRALHAPGCPSAASTSGAIWSWRVITGEPPGSMPGPAAAAHAVATSGSRPPCPPWSR